MVYHHRKIDRKLFEKYRRRFSPYCSVASLYLWAVAGGAIRKCAITRRKRRNEARTMTYTRSIMICRSAASCLRRTKRA